MAVVNHVSLSPSLWVTIAAHVRNFWQATCCWLMLARATLAEWASAERTASSNMSVCRKARVVRRCRPDSAPNRTR